MLVAILYLYAAVPRGDRQLQPRLHAAVAPHAAGWARSWPASPAFALAFAIKVPIFPLHTWLPDAHVEAPTGGSVILAGVLLKFGTYGFLRFALPMFPLAAAQAAPLLAILAVIGIIYGALMAYVQDDAKKLVAYSSVSHLGLRGPRHHDGDPHRRAGGHLPDAGARHLDGRPLLRGRPPLRPPPHAPARRLRRPVGQDAGVRRAVSGDRAGLGRSCPACAGSSASSWC